MTATIDVVGLLGGRPVGAAAEAAVRAARLVAGGADQLVAVADLLDPRAETATVAAGLAALDAVAGHPGPGPVVVLASGDPGFHGIVRALAARLGAERLVVHPAPSSVALAFARLGLAWDDAVVASCHTGDAAAAAALVARAPRAAVLCGPAAPPEAVGAALLVLGAHHPTVAVATRLGEPGEVVHRPADLRELAAGAYDHRSVVVLAHPEPAVAARRAHRRPARRRLRPPGRDDHQARGALGRARPPRPARAGSPVGRRRRQREHRHRGRTRRARAAGDRRRAGPRRRRAIVANAAALGAVVEVVTGAAPAALSGLPAPDRVVRRRRRARRPRRGTGRGPRPAPGWSPPSPPPTGRSPPGSRLGDWSRWRSTGPAAARRRRALRGRQPGVRRLGRPSATATSGTPRATSATRSSPSASAARRRRPPTTCRALDEADLAARRPAASPRRHHRPARRPPRRSRARRRPAGDLPGQPARHRGGAPPERGRRADAVGTPIGGRGGAALLAAGPGARLVVTKQPARPPPPPSRPAGAGRAPGRRHASSVSARAMPPPHARRPSTAVRGADAVVGYGPYVDAVADLLRPDQRVVRSDMGDEAEPGPARPLALARGRLAGGGRVVGRPGVFAMAAVTLEAGRRPGRAPSTRRPRRDRRPGRRRRRRGAAGRRPRRDHLSDLLVPWATIEAQLRAAAGAGMALALSTPGRRAGPTTWTGRRRSWLEVLAPRRSSPPWRPVERRPPSPPGRALGRGRGSAR